MRPGNDTQDYVCSISPEEFEKFCMKILIEYAKQANLPDFVIEHDVKMDSPDGIYQIDIYASCSVLGTTIKILCQCKQYKEKVKREKVQILEEKLRSLGMNKGILLSTSGFQKGAIQYAKNHGIALIQVFDHSCEPVAHSGGPNASTDDDDPFMWLEKNWPKYRAICWDDNKRDGVVLYPTKEMIIPLYEEQLRRVNEQYGLHISIDFDSLEDTREDIC